MKVNFFNKWIFYIFIILAVHILFYLNKTYTTADWGIGRNNTFSRDQYQDYIKGLAANGQRAEMVAQIKISYFNGVLPEWTINIVYIAYIVVIVLFFKNNSNKEEKIKKERREFKIKPVLVIAILIAIASLNVLQFFKNRKLEDKMKYNPDTIYIKSTIIPFPDTSSATDVYNKLPIIEDEKGGSSKNGKY